MNIKTKRIYVNSFNNTNDLISQIDKINKNDTVCIYERSSKILYVGHDFVFTNEQAPFGNNVVPINFTPKSEHGEVRTITDLNPGKVTVRYATGGKKMIYINDTLVDENKIETMKTNLSYLY